MPELRGGNSVYFNFVHSGGTMLPFQQYRTAGLEHTPNLIDTTSGNDGYKKYIEGIREWSFSAEMLFNGTETPMGSADYVVLMAFTEGTINFGPLGSGTGSVKFSGPVIVESCDMDMPYDDIMKLSVTWKGNGTLTPGTW